jgi:hypothetical protein
MSKEKLIELAKQAGWQYAHGDSGFEPLWAFADLVRADEREACAKLCAEDSVQAMDFIGGTFVGGYFAKKIIERNKS